MVQYLLNSQIILLNIHDDHDLIFHIKSVRYLANQAQSWIF